MTARRLSGKTPFAAAVLALVLPVSAETVFENGNVRLVFDDRGRVTSMKEKGTGRELVRNAVSFVTVRDRTGRMKNAVRMEKRGQTRYAWVFGEAGEEAVFTVEAFDGGWSFRNETCRVPACREMEFCRLDPVCRKYEGSIMNVLSDDDSAVCVRAYSYVPRAGRLWVRVKADDPDGLTGAAAGLYAGPRAGLIPAVRAMTVAAGAPHSAAGGAWALDSPDTDRSYMFCWPQSGPRWEELRDCCRRAGCGVFHLICWEESSEGTEYFQPSKRLFPGGLDEFRKVVDYFHDVGIKVSIHTYTMAIGARMPYLKAPWVRDLVSSASYTLARPFAPDDTELVVEERPGDRQWCEFGYWGGNVMRIGDELVQYTGVRREKPYAFTGVTRGAFKSPVGGTVPAGTRMDYLRVCYGCFFADPRSKLADRQASLARRTFETAGLDQIYFDASEGAGAPYVADGLRWKLAEAVTSGGRPVVIEASDYNNHSGWYHSRLGALDSPTWGAKRFHDRHLKSVRSTQENFLPGHLGWWSVSVQNGDFGWPWAPGKRTDEHEYFGCKAAAWDTSVSIQGMSVPRAGPASYIRTRMATLLGDWERARYAKCFKPGLQERMREGTREWRLRQGDDGIWRVAPQTAMTHRVSAPWRTAWTLDMPRAATAAELRVDALYGMENYDSTNAIVVFAAADAAKVKTGAADGVRARVVPSADAVHGPTMRFSAVNDGRSSYGAWAKAESFWGEELKGRSGGKPEIHRAFGVWVKGDGSGAVLDVSPVSFHSVGVHYIRLDFTGWRYFAFNAREKDIYDSASRLWPYSRELHRTFNDPLEVGSFKGLTFWLHDVPAGGKAEVEISDVHSLPECIETLADAVVTVAGDTFALPFPLRSGDWAELADGRWTRYSLFGEPLTSVRAAAPRLAAGANGVRFAAVNASGRPVRAEVTLYGVGPSEPAYAHTLTGAMRRKLSYEPLPPVRFRPRDGLADLPVLAVRPGETADLEVKLWGPVKNARLTVKGPAGEKTYGLAADLAAEKHVRVTVGPFSGTSRLAFACDDGEKADVRIDMVKSYRDPDGR